MQHRLALITCIAFCSITAPAQAQIALPELNTRRLLNDLQVVVAPTPYLGEGATIGLVLRYGAAFDPADKEGLANLLSRMFMKATIDRTAKDIEDELAFLGATIEIQCDWDGIRFIFRGQSSRIERALLLLYQIICEAQFHEQDFNAVKREILRELERPPDPRQHIHSRFESALFSGTTYGRPLTGTPKSLAAITLGEMRFFYHKFFTPSDASLVVVGNVSPHLVLQKASRIWGVWVRNDRVPFTFVAPRRPAGRKVFLEDDPSSPAAQFILGNLFPRRDDPLFVSAALAAGILRERLTRLLPTSLLSVRGEGRRLMGPFVIQGQAAAEQAVDQVVKILDAAQEMQNTPVSQEELAAAQKNLLEEFTRELKTTDGLCRIILDAELYGLGSNYAVSYPDQIRRCDVDAIRRAAMNYIFPGGVVLLMRGPASVLKPALESLGAVHPLVP